jgi:hypothetical protein
MSPARRYLLMTTPAEDIVLSMSSRPAGSFRVEEPLAAAEQNREGPQRVLVDEVVLDQGLQEPAAAVDWISPLRASLSAAATLGSRLRGASSCSTSRLHGGGGHVLGDAIQHRTDRVVVGTCGQCAAKIS